jgi:Guanylate-binding protein, N-terminal domain
VLELGEDEDTGEPLTAQDYLEKCLKEQEGFSSKIADKNRIRTLIKTFFKVRIISCDNMQCRKGTALL